MGNKYTLKVLGASLLLASASLQAAINNEIIMSIEEPSEGSVMTGIANLRGWAVAPVKINQIEWFLDGKSMGIIPYGGNREDVAQQHPQLLDSGLSGYASTLNYSLLSNGAHTLRVRVVDVNGDHNESTISFNVTRFDSSFIKGENGVSIANAEISKQGETILLNNVEANGKTYNLVLKWNPATQRFDPADITLVQEPVVTPNQAPTATNDSGTVTQDSSKISLNVLANDADPEKDTLTIVSVTNPSNGTAAIENGQISYTPASGFSGTDQFSYTIEDSHNNQSTANVTIIVQVNSVTLNQPPKTANDSGTVTQDSGKISLNVLANDTDPEKDTLTIVSVTNPANGTAVIENGQISYTPASGFSGTDQFSYTVEDGHNHQSTANVTITVNAKPVTTPQIPDVKGQWSIKATLSEGGCSILPRADADYDLTTQNSADFSGTVSSNGITVPVSGQVETNGQFKSSSTVTVQGCTVSSEIEGNFLTNDYKTTISGLAPITAPACILAQVCLGSIYTGTITRK